MRLTRREVRTLQKFRRSPYARFLEDIVERELEQSRHQYESTLASEGQRGYILGLRAVKETLFSDKPTIED